jgi:hypothetical protein
VYRVQGWTLILPVDTFFQYYKANVLISLVCSQRIGNEGHVIN